MKVHIIAIMAIAVSPILCDQTPKPVPLPSFKSISVPLQIEKKTFEGTFLQKEKERLKQDVKDPWSWFSSILKHTGTGMIGPLASLGYPTYKRWADAYTFPDSQTDRIVVGEMIFSETIIASPPTQKLGPFSLRQVSIPLVIRPTWSKITDFADDFSHVAFELQVVSSNGTNSPIQICDILPNTKFVPANHGGKANFCVGLQANRKWGPLDASAGADGTFWWAWNPKVNVVASGAAGNTAFILLNKKPDKSGWVGKLPIELLLMVPQTLTSANILVRCKLVYKDEKAISLAEVKGTLLFYE